MVKRTKLEIYGYAKCGTMKDFAAFIGISPVALWEWVVKRRKPSKSHAQLVERLTNGEITETYLREVMD